MNNEICVLCGKKMGNSNNRLPKILGNQPLHKLCESQLILRSDGRLEWVCNHKVGHTIWAPASPNLGLAYSHGCDGCCKQLKQYRDKKRIKWKDSIHKHRKE